MDQIAGRHDRRIETENIAGAFWIALLVGGGCLLLNGLAASARREECFVRGPPHCSAALVDVKPSPARPLAEPKGIGAAAYLKASRAW